MLVRTVDSEAPWWTLSCNWKDSGESSSNAGEQIKNQRSQTWMCHVSKAPSETTPSSSWKPASRRTGLCWWQLCRWKMEGQTSSSSHRSSVGETLDLNWLYAVDPLVLLLRSRCRDSVKRVVSLNDTAIRLRLAGFDHLIFVFWDEELKAVLIQSRRNGSGIYVDEEKRIQKKKKKQSSAEPLQQNLPVRARQSGEWTQAFCFRLCAHSHKERFMTLQESWWTLNNIKVILRQNATHWCQQFYVL